jgi:hypothetical protein
MGTDRFDQLPVLRGHWMALGRRSPTRTIGPDRWARTVLLVVPAIVTLSGIIFSWRLANPDGLLAGVSLLAGSLVGVFSLLATWRERLADRQRMYSEVRSADCAAVDEAVVHVLIAILTCVIIAVLLVAGGSGSTHYRLLTTIWASVVYGFSSYLTLVFLMIIPALYSAYIRSNAVSDDLNGFVYRFNDERRSAS